MRLLVDCHVFDGKFQGTRTYLQGLYQNMTTHSDIEFFFAAQDIENLKRYFGESNNIHYIVLKNSGSLKRLAFEYPSLTKKYSIDYAHYQYVSPLKKACKEIVTIHDLLFLDFPQYFPLSYRLKNGFFFRHSAKRADLLLTVSEYSKNAICRHFHISKEKVFLTPNAVLDNGETSNIDVKKAWNLNKYILTVSRIEPRKNQLSLLKAFARSKLYACDYKLVFIGSPDLNYREFHEYFNHLPKEIKEHVVMRTASFGELVALYKNADLFVFPSFAEGFGIPPLEAVIYGCPILCSNTTAMAEFAFPEEMIFDPHNVKELEEKMLCALEEPFCISPMQKKMQAKYDWGQISENFYQLLRNSRV